MTGGKKLEYPRGHAKITGFFVRRKITSDFLKKKHKSTKKYPLSGLF